MKGASKCFGIGVGVLLLVGGMGLSKNMAKRVELTTVPGGRGTAAGPRAVESYGKLPLSFEVNRGQTDAQVRFLARGQGYGLFLTSQEAVLSLQKAETGSHLSSRFENRSSKLVGGRFALFSEPSFAALERFEPRGEERTANAANAVLHMQIVGANGNARVSGEEELPGRSNYFIANDPKKWRTNIPTYAKARFENVYPGVDLVYYGNQGQLEYDFVVKPGADQKAIKLALAASSPAEGGGRNNANELDKKSGVQIAGNGDLAVQVDGGEVRFHKPVIYQPASSGDAQETTDRIPVDGHYTIDDQNEVAFAISKYDKTKPLVIDPVLVYSTYLSGSNQAQGYAIAVDTSGDAYVTGYTTSSDFPTAPNAFQRTPLNNFPHVFVTKFSPCGSKLLYSTYLGGSGSEQARGIAVNGSGNAYVTGITISSDFPTVNPFQASYAGNLDSFVTKLNSDGSALLYSTYLGGSGNDEAQAIAIDSPGSAYVTGFTGSTDFPTTPGAFQGTKQANVANVFVTKLSPSGSALAYSSYLGGSNFAVGAGIAVDRTGSAYLTGRTGGTDFPTVNPFQSTNQSASCNQSAAFVSKINTEGSALVYSTYLGGSCSAYQNFPGYFGGAVGNAIAVDDSGSAYVTGGTASTDFPTTSGAFQESSHSQPGRGNTFVTKFNADGSGLVYSTYLGGGYYGNGPGNAIAIDSAGSAYVTGIASYDLPTANPFQASNNARNTGGWNAFVTEFTPDGSGLVYSSYLGGSGNDTPYGIAVDGSGNTYVTGSTNSADFPTANPYQATNNSANYSAFVSKISPLEADLAITDTAPSSVTTGSTITYTIVATNNGPDPASNVNIGTVVRHGTTFNSVSVSAGTCKAPVPGGQGIVTCTASNLASGGSITETLTVNITAGSGTVIRDTANVSSATFDPNTANHEARATTTVM